MAEMKYKAPPMANEKEMRALSIIPVPDDRKVKEALKHLKHLVEEYRPLMLAMESCARCGHCAENCHTYLGTRDPNNIPTNRADLFRKAWKAAYTLEGKLFGKLAGAEPLTLDTINKMYAYFYQCNECRRCALVCPFGIDTCEVTFAGRQLLHWLGMVPNLHAQVGAAMYKTGNHTGLPKAGLVDTCEFLEEEMKEETGVDIKIPIDKPNSDILYIPSSADFLLNPETMMGVAKFFHYLGVNWTMSSEIAEAGNFGLLFDQRYTLRHNIMRLSDEIVKLNVKKVVWGECGHGWRAGKMYVPSMTDRPINVPIVHLHDEVSYYIRTGQLKLNPEVNNRTVTLHDPCNFVRACNLGNKLREVLRACVTHFKEMTPNNERNFCCGGGSAILFDDPVMYDLRIKFSAKKAEQVRATGVGENGEGILVAPCSICKAQLYPMVEEHQLGVEVKGLIDLVGKALYPPINN
ncbi:(Fe-S)-binding protein [Peptococcaceae bacterium]|nr:(Fe-S)-binding protein [Peptococcaceae bacterium]MCL0077692.1 (Fe-S)-binding protein [Peptococcaceae bacterium]